MLLHLRPELVDMAKAVDEVEGVQTSERIYWDLAGSGGVTFQEFFSRNTVSGVQGQPTLGTAEKGARTFEAAVSRLASFLEEFRNFTQVVAGKLDFGIYSFCLDRMFGSLRIPLKVKKLLVLEILRYPPIVRRELLTNVLAYRGQARELIEFVKYMVATELGKNAAIEIELLEAFKLQRLSMEDIQVSLMARPGRA